MSAQQEFVSEGLSPARLPWMDRFARAQVAKLVGRLSGANLRIQDASGVIELLGMIVSDDQQREMGFWV